MAEIKKKTTKEVKKVETKLNPKVWEVAYNEDLVAQVLYVYNSNARKGTAVVKDRSEVSGGGRKPWKQKGTGRARVGSSRSPIWIGGGVTFGNVGEKNWSKKVNKKMARKATCIMLSARLRNKALEFFNETSKEAKKVREDISKLGSSVLVISDSEELQKTVRNVKGISFVTSQKVNAKHLVSNQAVYVDNKIVETLEKRLTNDK